MKDLIIKLDTSNVYGDDIFHTLFNFWCSSTPSLNVPKNIREVFLEFDKEFLIGNKERIWGWDFPLSGIRNVGTGIIGIAMDDCEEGENGRFWIVL
jgi:hypothetical protein